MIQQLLTITLDGITASDYLTWVADREPAALGGSLHSITTEADPLGSTIHIALAWNGAPPAAAPAAAAAGFPLTPEVVALEDALPRPKATPRVRRPDAFAASQRMAA